MFARDQFNFLKDMEKVKGQKVDTIAVLYENTEFGSNVGKEVVTRRWVVKAFSHR